DRPVRVARRTRRVRPAGGRAPRRHAALLRRPDRRADARRPGPVARRPRQPAAQRARRLHRGLRDHGLAAPGAGGGRDPGPRHRQRHGGGRAGEGVHAVLQHEEGRHRTRARDRAPHRRAARRDDPRRLRAGTRHAVHDRSAARPRARGGAAMRLPVLVVDDDDALRETLRDALDVLDVEVDAAANGREALERIAERRYAVVLTDLVMKDVDGRRAAGRLVRRTGHGSRGVAVQAMQQGATYYVEKPVDLAELRTKVTKCLESYRRDLEFDELRSRVERRDALEGIIGQDPKMARLFEVVRQIAPTNATVLIQGESGTGKELVARAVHRLSPRSAAPFVALNCGGLNEGTIESELFGHVKGAFTGALDDREGKFEYADQGTLFLDEVGEMPPQTQVKFLRVLEQREVSRLGSNRTRKIDVRVVAATNADLEEKVRNGEFRG